MSPPPVSSSALAVVAGALTAAAGVVVSVSGSTAPAGGRVMPSASAPAAVGAAAREPTSVSSGALPPRPGLAPRARGEPPTLRDEGRWAWPLDPVPRVVRTFRAPQSQWGPGHRGLDLAARLGDRVHAVEGGVVTHVGVIAGRGTVSVRHPDGLVSTYEPVASELVTGEEVRRGAELGVLDRGGSGSHCATSTCLHLGARRAGAYLDPWPLLAGGEVVLLPLWR